MANENPDTRTGDRHRRAPVSVRLPVNVWKMLELARGTKSRNQFLVDATVREIRRILGPGVLRDD
jgi:hypothetical protein